MIKSVCVSLNTIDKVSEFVKKISIFENKFELVSEENIINAKSILGIFSLDLVKPMYLNIYGSDNMDKIIDILACYMVP